eukprot:5730545-Prorocentrum_lima.AAC.1
MCIRDRGSRLLWSAFLVESNIGTLGEGFPHAIGPWPGAKEATSRGHGQGPHTSPRWRWQDVVEL